MYFKKDFQNHLVLNWLWFKKIIFANDFDFKNYCFVLILIFKITKFGVPSIYLKNISENNEKVVHNYWKRKRDSLLSIIYQKYLLLKVSTIVDTFKSIYNWMKE